jgi:hypothetical protein
LAGSLVGKFLRLPGWERALLMRSVLALATARLAIWVLPFNTARRLVVGRRREVAPPRLTPAQVRWGVDNARRVVPRATCLPQALAAESLLAYAGHPALVRIGVMKTPAGKLEAHAWVESGGRIVIGGLTRAELGRFTPLPPLPGPRSG